MTTFSTVYGRTDGRMDDSPLRSHNPTYFFFFVSSVQSSPVQVSEREREREREREIMEFPFGGHHNIHHHHHHRNEEEEEEEYPQPPPSYHHHQQQHNTPPPPDFGTTVESHQHYGPPPPNYMYEQDGGMYQRPPQQPDFSGGYGYSSGVYSAPPVQHVSHDLNHHQQRFEPEDPSEFRHHHHHTPPTSFVYQHTHETETETDVVGGENELFNVPTVRVYSKAEPGYSLTIRDGRVILAPSDPTDVFQHWIKDEKYSVRVKDEEGFPSFSLVNKATGQAIKHSIGATHPVQLRPYHSDDLDESVLWTESRNLGDGFRTIRMVNNIRLNLDAFHGDINHGGVHDGTTIVLWEWKKGDNQRWRIVRY